MSNMNSINEQLDRLETYKTNIKSAIIEKGQTVGDNMGEYAEAINNIKSGPNIENSLDFMDANVSIQQQLRYYYTSDGTVFVSSNLTKMLYMLKEDMAYKFDIYTDFGVTAYSLNYFFESDGVYYFSLQTTQGGFFMLKNGVVTKIINEGYYSQFYKSSDGTLFFGGPKGLYVIKNDVINKLLDFGSSIFFYEDSDGTVYIGSGSYTGLYAYKDGELKTIDSKLMQWTTFTKSVDGTLYICSSDNYTVSDNYIYGIKDGVAKGYETDHYSFPYTLAASDGTVYFGSFASTAPIISIKDGVLKQLTPSRDSKYHIWKYFFEGSDGTIYASGDGQTGLVSIKDDVVTWIVGQTQSSYYMYFFESSDGTIYASNNVSSSSSYWKGLITIKNGVVNHDIIDGTSWQYFFEGSDGTVYMSNSSNGLYSIKGTTTHNLITGSGDWNNFIENEHGVYVSSKSYNGLYKLTQSSATICPNTNNNAWTLYNGIYISLSDYKYQFDFETDTVINRVMDIPKVRHSYLSVGYNFVPIDI